MCLISFAWNAHPDYRLIVAANRDEFYRRPTEPVQHWPDAPQIIAGRDKKAGGTWLGVTSNGRFAALTNARGGASPKNAASRGLLVQAFLSGELSAADFARSTSPSLDQYAGCNLLVADAKQMFYLTNFPDCQYREVPAGIHALSNGHMDDLWPKMRKVRDGLADKIDDDDNALFELMSDRHQAEEAELPNTGVGKLLEKQLSSVFIKLPSYGTRCTTVLHLDHEGKGRFSERRFDGRGRTVGQNDIEISTE